MSELVHLDVDAGVATITLDSPANRNALSAQLRRELLAHLDTALADDAGPGGRARPHRAGVLLGHGPQGVPRRGRGRPGRQRGARDPAADLDGARSRWSRRSAGPTRAGGVGLVAACDIAVAATAATFAFSEVRIGVVPAVISVTVLPRLLPRAAHELFLTGRDVRRAARRRRRAGQRGGARRGARRRGGALRRHAAARRARRARGDEGDAARRAPGRAGRPVRRDAHAVRPVLRGRGGPGGHARVRREAPAPLGDAGPRTGLRRSRRGRGRTARARGPASARPAAPRPRRRTTRRRGPCPRWPPRR